MFNYDLEREKIEQYKKDFPEFTSEIAEYWKKQAEFTIEEIIPTLEKYLPRTVNMPCHIQYRIVLTENEIKQQVLQNKKPYHFILEYYCIPIEEKLVIPNHIYIGSRFYDYKIENGAISLTPMDEYEQAMKRHMDTIFKNFLEKEKLVTIKNKKKINPLIMVEEKDIDKEDIISRLTWRSSKLLLEQTKRYIDPFLYPFIKSYIETRQNNILSNETSFSNKGKSI